MKTFFTITISGAIVSTVISLLAGDDFLLKFIDYYFYFGLFTLIIGIFILVSGKGFFDIFRWSSKKIISSYNKSYKDYKNSTEADPQELKYAKPLICSGVSILLLTYIIAITMF